MNKIILYVGLAILLGTVTMVAPLALLQDNNPLSDDKYIVVTTTGGTLENETRNDYQTLSPETPSDKTLGIPEPSDSVAADSDVSPEESETWGIFTSNDSGTDLSPIALITVPSFLVALGVFVFLRKQVS